MQRTHLPIPAQPRQGLITFDAKDPDTGNLDEPEQQRLCTSEKEAFY